MNLKSRERTAKALQYNGDKNQEQEFLDAIGPGSQFLRTKFETVGGPGRGAVMGFFICSGKETWVLKPGLWLVIFSDGPMKVMSKEEILLFFEETR